MRVFGLIAVIVPAIALSLSPSAAPAQTHPAVARIIVPESNGASLGSGTLVAVNERYGLVVTNWHVVRDGNGHVIVAFPDGFHSGASVVKADRDWDLAALVIWRPRVAPVPLADAVPRKGDPLTIAGYGSGKFRMATGRCTQYVSPGGSLPFEMLELSAQARQGDSGGPILNQNGQLAGVLFGASWGRTAGSHCGRVRQFLASVSGEFNDLPDGRTMIAARTTPVTTPQAIQPGGTYQHPAAANGQAYAANAGLSAPRQALPTAAIAARTVADPQGNAVRQDAPYGVAASQDAPDNQATSQPLRWEDLAGDTWPSRIKTLLAMVGIFAVFVQAVRWLG